jgi:hypothetical protein
VDVPPKPTLEFLFRLVLAAWALDSVLIDGSLFRNPGVQFCEGDIGGPLIGIVFEAVDVELVIEVHSK